MQISTDDLRIKEIRELRSPAEVIGEFPRTDRATKTVIAARHAIHNILHGHDDRLLVVIGPCSIHDPVAALDYAHRLADLRARLAGTLEIAMRVYFEKPRTTVGWKGLINDPNLDGSFEIDTGLRTARELLLKVNDLGLPAACEFLDMTTPQYIADLVSWAAIGARTTESQVHRELASGLSMPVGFKNGTDGSTQTAVDAVLAARSPHWFPSVTKQGVSAIFHTTGNESCHVILRGGSRTGPNYEPSHVAEVCAKLTKHKLPETVMIDCSHGNSHKDHTKQKIAAASICEQVAGGSWNVFGAMIESHLVEGRQDYMPGRQAVYGQSITDACISLEQTEPILEQMAAAQQKRGTR